MPGEMLLKVKALGFRSVLKVKKKNHSEVQIHIFSAALRKEPKQKKTSKSTQREIPMILLSGQIQLSSVSV